MAKQDLPNVIMFGPDLSATSGISNVVNNWIEGGLGKKVRLTYIPTLKFFVPGRFFFKFLEATCAYVKFLKIDADQIDIIHLHVSTGVSLYRKFFLFLIAKMKRSKVIVHLHASNFVEFYQKNNPFTTRIIHTLFQNADIILVLSKFWMEFCSPLCSKDKIQILYNGASSQKYAGEPKIKEVLNITTMGRLGRRKGTYDLIEAFERLSRKYPNIHLILGGDGDVEIVKKIIKEKGLQRRVDVLGWVSGKVKIQVFKDADIYILPSYKEGLPGSILEAMAASTPIISTEVGGIPEIVIPHVNGFLINSGDINSMVKYLELLIKNQQLRINMGNESKRMLTEHFDTNIIVEQLVSCYMGLYKQKLKHNVKSN